MLLNLCKRGYLTTAPWVFGQSSLPTGYKQLNEPLSSSLITKFEPGFFFAFNSILDSYETKDTESLKQCFEGNLFSHVEKGFSKLSKENIEFKRLHNDVPIMIPLSFHVYIGASINRSENSSIKEIDVISLDDNTANPKHSMFRRIALMSLPEKSKEFFKNAKIYTHQTNFLNLVFSIEVAFTGKKFLSLMKEEEDLSKDYSGNYFHIFKFETELSRLPFGLVNALRLSQHFSNLINFGRLPDSQWIVCDIDNQLGGNPIVYN